MGGAYLKVVQSSHFFSPFVSCPSWLNSCSLFTTIKACHWKEENLQVGVFFFCWALMSLLSLKDELGGGGWAELKPLNACGSLINEDTGDGPLSPPIGCGCLFWLRFHRWMCPTCGETMAAPCLAVTFDPVPSARGPGLSLSGHWAAFPSGWQNNSVRNQTPACSQQPTQPQPTTKPLLYKREQNSDRPKLIWKWWPFAASLC